MKKFLSKFQSTPLGSFTKVFLFAMLYFGVEAYANGSLVFPVKKEFLDDCLRAGAIAILPTLYNWLNPNYKAYGRKKVESLPADRIV